MSEKSYESVDMEPTGERMIPSSVDKATFWEHIARYRFAMPFVKGKRVLDIACGEGYGSAAMMLAGVQSVVGVDISPEACQHANQRYGIDARVGSAENIPLEDHSVDVIVSFETIEHVKDPALFIGECRRVLAPQGVLIMSTPNKEEYHKIASDNPFHCSELQFDEFKALLAAQFASSEFYGQYVPTRWYWRTRGIGRLCAFLQHRIVPEVTAPLNAQDRIQVLEHILKPLRPLEAVMSPWIVQADTEQVIRQSRYVVAVSR